MGRPAKINQAAAIAAWHSDATAAECARLVGVSPEYLRIVWQRLRRAKQLPDMSRAAAQAQRLGAARPARVAGLDLEPEEFGAVIPIGADDPLLAALVREHADDVRRRDDDLTAVLGARRAWPLLKLSGDKHNEEKRT